MDKVKFLQKELGLCWKNGTYMPAVAKQAREVLGIGSSGAFNAASMAVLPPFTPSGNSASIPDQIEVCYRLMTQPRGEVALNVD